MNMTTDKDLENVSGGTPYANGSFVDNGNCIVYTVAAGDTLVGIGSRFGGNFMQIAQWNKAHLEGWKLHEACSLRVHRWACC